MSSISSIGGTATNIGSSMSGFIKERLAVEDEVLKSSEASAAPIAYVAPNIIGEHSAIQTIQEVKVAELQGKSINPGESQLIKAIEQANKAMLGATTSFEFVIHEKTKQIMVKVLDKDTGKIIREIPSEKTLDMISKMWELAGIIVDKKV